MYFVYLIYMLNSLQVGLLNVDGYYNSLLSFIDKAVEEGFINRGAQNIIVSAPTAKELVKKLEVCDFILYIKHVILFYFSCAIGDKLYFLNGDA